MKPMRAYAASQISPKLSGRINQFGWLQGPAITKVLRSVTFANPITSANQSCFPFSQFLESALQGMLFRLGKSIVECLSVAIS